MKIDISGWKWVDTDVKPIQKHECATHGMTEPIFLRYGGEFTKPLCSACFMQWLNDNFSFESRRVDK